MRKMAKVAIFIFLVIGPLFCSGDVASDTWVATDGLGRNLPTFAEVGAPRENRTVALFYFLWHLGGPGPFDLSKILAQDPHVLQRQNSPLLGPWYASHHWGESLFGYYLSNDPAVYRKHAQMLADAGVDVIIFDVTNGPTYDSSWRALMETFASVRSAGGNTPQIAFLCPFSTDAPNDARGQVVRHLWEALYKPKFHPELWFHWQGKPLIMAHPSYALPKPAASGNPIENHGRFPARLSVGHTLGQLFKATAPVYSVSAVTPTYGTHKGVACTLALRVGGPKGKIVASRRVTDIADNEGIVLNLDVPAPAGIYYLEISEPEVSIGWWSQEATPQEKQSISDIVNGNAQLNGVLPLGAYADGKYCGGYREFRAYSQDVESAAIQAFFTFRRPIPGYGYTGRAPLLGGWSWLEIYPQHVYGDFDGNPEMMSVGVAQNSKPTRICAMSEPGAMGRRWHDGANDTRPETISWGLNFQEQWNHALKADPKFLFVTSWNEWWASRFPEWMGWKEPGGVFPDQFDPEHSRDCEPTRGLWGDAYYWQLVANIRRYKGVRPIPTIRPFAVQIDGKFEDWQNVTPIFYDTPNDPMKRDWPGWGKGMRYQDNSGRNDIIQAQVTWDDAYVYFHVHTRSELTPPSTDWMRLFIDADQNSQTGWLGYDYLVEREGNKTVIKSHQSSDNGSALFAWSKPCETCVAEIGKYDYELAIPRKFLAKGNFDFKWADNCIQEKTWEDFTLHGDAAPNDRYNYRATLGN